MKISVLIFMLLNLPFIGFSQASSSSEFEITVMFDKNIPVKDLTVSYYKKSGNHFDQIGYTINKTENSMTISGRNSFILYVDFPILAFSETKKLRLFETGEKVLQTKMYYLVSHIITSYTGTQIQSFHFSKEKDAKILLAKQEKNNTQDSHRTLTVSEIKTYNGDFFEMPMTTEMVWINKL